MALCAASFSKMLYNYRYKTKYGLKLNDGKSILDNRNVKADEEDFKATNLAITKRIFEGKKTLSLNEFFCKRDRIQENLWHYEFHQYDHIEGGDKCLMPMEEFAKSQLLFLPIGKMKRYLDIIHKNEAISNKFVTYEEYVAWQYFLKNIDAVLQHVNEFRTIDRERFTHMVRHHEKRF